MSYIQVELSFQPRLIDADSLTASMMLLGFDSFEEKDNLLICYIPDNEWNEAEFNHWLSTKMKGRAWLVSCLPLEERNWNEVWESNFPPVIIAGKCLVRAPFHEPDPAFPLELVIEPKMSFGTAHHETTSQVIELMLGIEWKNLTILDMGCGTGILAVLAVKLGARHVLAVDNDTWAYENTIENIQRNQAEQKIEVRLGDADLISGLAFDVIIANINRNILVRDMPEYVKSLVPGGLLILSGFYREDLPVIEEQASELNLGLRRYLVQNNWVAAVFNHLA